MNYYITIENGPKRTKFKSNSFIANNSIITVSNESISFNFNLTVLFKPSPKDVMSDILP